VLVGKHTAANTIWAESRKYNMGQKQKIHAEENAENTSGPHDESTHGGGRRPHHIACIFSICTHMHFLRLPHIVLSAFGPYCISGPAGIKNSLLNSASLYLMGASLVPIESHWTPLGAHRSTTSVSKPWKKQ